MEKERREKRCQSHLGHAEHSGPRLRLGRMSASDPNPQKLPSVPTSFASRLISRCSARFQRKLARCDGHDDTRLANRRMHSLSRRRVVDESTSWLGIVPRRYIFQFLRRIVPIARESGRSRPDRGSPDSRSPCYAVRSVCVPRVSTTHVYQWQRSSLAGPQAGEGFADVVTPSNICRSPLAEAVFADICKKRGLDIQADSAGTAGYHVGEEPVRISTIVIGSRRTSKLTSLPRSPGPAVSWPSTPMSTTGRLRFVASRSTAVCKKHGVPINSTCRQLAVSLLYGPILCRKGQAR